MVSSGILAVVRRKRQPITKLEQCRNVMEPGIRITKCSECFDIILLPLLSFDAPPPSRRDFGSVAVDGAARQPLLQKEGISVQCFITRSAH